MLCVHQIHSGCFLKETLPEGTGAERALGRFALGALVTSVALANQDDDDEHAAPQLLDQLRDDNPDPRKLVAYLTAKTLQSSGLPTDEMEAFKWLLAEMVGRYDMVAEQQDLELSSSETDRDRWAKMIEGLHTASESVAAAWDKLVGADWCRVRVPRQRAQQLIITHYSKNGSVIGKCTGNMGESENEHSQPAARFAESVFRAWGRKAQAMGVREDGGPQKSFADALDGEYLEYTKQDGERKLTLQVLAELPGRETMAVVQNGTRTDAYVLAAAARTFLLCGQLEDAYSSYNQAVAAEPSNGAYAEAANHADRLIRMKEYEVAGSAALGRAELQTALNEFQAAQDLDPEPTLNRRQLRSQAAEMLLKGPGFLAAAVVYLRDALIDAQRVECVDSAQDDARLAAVKPVLAVRWGVTRQIWIRVYRYFLSAWADGRRGLLTFEYAVLGRPGMPLEGAGTVEQRGFDLVDQAEREHLKRMANDPTIDNSLLDPDSFIMNIQKVTNVDSLATGTAAEAHALDMSVWTNDLVVHWMAKDTYLQSYAAKAKDAKVLGITLEVWRLCGGAGYDDADATVRALGFVEKADRKRLLELLDKHAPAQSAYYVATLARDRREEYLRCQFVRAIDGQVVIGRGSTPPINRASGLTRAGMPGDLMWTLNQRHLRESLSNERAPVSYERVLQTQQ